MPAGALALLTNGSIRRRRAGRHRAPARRRLVASRPVARDGGKRVSSNRKTEQKSVRPMAFERRQKAEITQCRLLPMRSLTIISAPASGARIIHQTDVTKPKIAIIPAALIGAAAPMRQQHAPRRVPAQRPGYRAVNQRHVETLASPAPRLACDTDLIADDRFTASPIVFDQRRDAQAPPAGGCVTVSASGSPRSATENAHSSLRGLQRFADQIARREIGGPDLRRRRSRNNAAGAALRRSSVFTSRVDEASAAPDRRNAGITFARAKTDRTRYRISPNTKTFRRLSSLSANGNAGRRRPAFKNDPHRSGGLMPAE